MNKLLPSWLTNKYLLTLAGFIVWMFFFDDRAFYITCVKQPGELAALKKNRLYYEQQIAATKQELNQLKINAFAIEKYAREKYMMKKDNEDLFIVESTKSAR